MARTLGWMWLGTLALVLLFLYSIWGGLPGNLMVHFDLAGRPNGCLEKGAFLASFLGTVLALNGAFGLLAVFMGRIPLEWVNVPFKAQWTSTPERIAALRARLKALPVLLGLFTDLVFLFVIQVVHQENVPGAPFHIPINAGVFLILSASAALVPLLLLLFRPPAGE